MINHCWVQYMHFILRNLPRSSEELKNWMIRLYQVRAEAYFGAHAKQLS